MKPRLITPAERVAELVEEYGSYRAAAKATGIALGHIYRLSLLSPDARLPTAKMLKRLGFVIPAKFELDK